MTLAHPAAFYFATACYLGSLQIASGLEQSLVASRVRLFEIFRLEQRDNGNGM